MKTTALFLMGFLLISVQVDGQIFDRLKRAAQRSAERAAERQVENRTTKATDRAIDGVLDGKKGSNTDSSTDSKNKKNKNNSLEEDGGIAEVGANEVGFKRGSRLIFQDDFSRDAVGDFPAKWNTTKSGEVKNLKGMGKFLKIPAGSVINPEISKTLPENFTLEFDLVCPSAHPIRYVGIGFGNRPQAIDYLSSNSDAVTFDLLSADKMSDRNAVYYADKALGGDKLKVKYTAPLDRIVKIAYEVNGKRIRMFVDGRKMVDLPTQFKPNYRKAFFLNSITNGWAETKDAYFYIGNFVLAETGKDERSSVLKDLMEKGSFSTNAILFATGSDKIQAESNDIIQQIYDALSQAPDMKVKIVGHTDSDGNAKDNQKLSEKRANAVKMKLASMGISSSRMQTEGKGQSQPIADNSSAAGKAQNRRVEFIKL